MGLLMNLWSASGSAGGWPVVAGLRRVTQLCSTWSPMLSQVSLALFMAAEQGPRRRNRGLQGLLKSRLRTGMWHVCFILLAKTRPKADPRVRMGRDHKVSRQKERTQGGC